MAKKSSFIRNLEVAKKKVESWPAWKRNIIKTNIDLIRMYGNGKKQNKAAEKLGIIKKGVS